MVEGLCPVPQWCVHDPPPWSDQLALDVYTDASDLGMGGFMFPEWFSTPYVASMAYARAYSINWREMLVAVTALATWGPRMVGRNVYFHIDNQSVVFALRKHYSPVPHMMSLIRSWCLMLVQYDVNVRIVYIQTDVNIDADDLSRLHVTSFQERNPGALPTPTWPTPPHVN